MNNGPEFNCKCAAQVFKGKIIMILINGENKKYDFDTGSIDKF